MSAAPVINIQQFLEERRSGVGGSDVHDLFSLEPYGCRRQLYYEKTGQKPDYEKVVTGPMRRGLKLEQVAAEEYAIETGRQLMTTGLRRHPKDPRLIVHVDRFIKDQERGWGTLEIKTVNREIWFRIKKDGFPDSAVLQLQHALGITNHTWGAVAIFWADGWEFMHADIERDDRTIKLIQDEAKSFWSEVERRTPPAQLDPSDKRCAKCIFKLTCHELFELSESDPLLEFDPELAGAAKEYLEAKELVTQAEHLKDEAAAELKAKLGDRLEVQYGQDRRERITYKVVNRKAYSVKETSFRMLRVYGAEE